MNHDHPWESVSELKQRHTPEAIQRRLEAGPRSLRDWVPDRSFHRVADPGVPGPD